MALPGLGSRIGRDEHRFAPVTVLNDPFYRLLGESPAMDALRAFGRRAAAVDAPVLLTGESGTGKGMLAAAIHQASARATRPFITVNCAGVPASLFESEFFGHVRGAFTGARSAHRGLVEQASGGTLLLDEVGELPPPLQAKLLAVLEDGFVRRLGAERTVATDARVIAATNGDLHAAVRTGAFRRDLLYRLLVLSMELPPLRDRHGDIDVLASRLLERHARHYQRPARALAPVAMAALRAYPWPGNVRELDHTLQAAVLACDTDTIRERHLPERVRAGPDGAAAPEPPRRGGRYRFDGTPAEERALIEAALLRCRGNRTRAAAALGMSRTTLRAHIRALGIAAGTGRTGQ